MGGLLSCVDKLFSFDQSYFQLRELLMDDLQRGKEASFGVEDRDALFVTAKTIVSSALRVHLTVNAQWVHRLVRRGSREVFL